MSDEGLIEAFCTKYAYYLFSLRIKSNFTKGLTFIQIHNKLKLAGKPNAFARAYKNQLENVGFGKADDSDMSFIETGIAMFDELYIHQVEEWVKEDKITIPYPDGQEVFDLSSQGEQGYIYLAPELSARAMVLFKSKEDIKKENTTTGRPVNIESLVTIGEPKQNNFEAAQVNNA